MSSLWEKTDEELVQEYLELRKRTKHEKRGRGMALSPELKRQKRDCLDMKDEITRRGLDHKVAQKPLQSQTNSSPSEARLHLIEAASHDNRDINAQDGGP